MQEEGRGGELLSTAAGYLAHLYPSKPGVDPQIIQLSSEPWAGHEPFDWKNNATSIGRSLHVHCMMYSECIHANS